MTATIQETPMVVTEEAWHSAPYQQQKLVGVILGADRYRHLYYGNLMREHSDEGNTRGSRQHLCVPNTVIGRLFIWALRRWLNRKSYTLVLRGRTVDVRRARRYILAQQAAANPDHYGASVTDRLAHWRTASDTRVRQYFSQSIPPRCAKRIGVYINRKRPA